MLPVKPMHDGVFIDIVDRNITQKDLGDGKVLHLIADDSFAGPYDPVGGGRHSGIRPRWARVLAIGPEVVDVQIGDLVLCDTLKWGRKVPLGRDGQEVVYFWNIKVTDILVVSDEKSSAENYIKEFQTKLKRMDLSVGHL